MPQVWVVVDHFTLYADLFQLILMSKQTLKTTQLTTDKCKTRVRVYVKYKRNCLEWFEVCFLNLIFERKKYINIKSNFCPNRIV